MEMTEQYISWLETELDKTITDVSDVARRQHLMIKTLLEFQKREKMLRNVLTEAGIVVTETSEGISWRRK